MPKTARRAALTSGRHSLSQQLRDLIDSRGLTAYGAAKLAGVDPAVVSRFMDGTRDIRMATGDKLAGALGLRLVEVGRGARGRGAKTRPTDTPAESARVRPPEAPDRESEDFAVNLGAGEVYDESGLSQTVPNPDPSPEGPGILSQNQ